MHPNLSPAFAAAIEDVTFDLGPRDDDAPCPKCGYVAPAVEAGKFYEATMETRNFKFSVVGLNRIDVRNALVRTLEAHGKQHDLGREWWKRYDINECERQLGRGYRDGEVVA